MDSIRISKVESVTLAKGRQTSTGTLHLTAHHLIFRPENAEQEEMWIAYPLISLLTRLPQDLHGHCALSIRTRTFDMVTVTFQYDTEAMDVFDSVKELTVSPAVENLYAFNYNPNPPLEAQDGWNIYSLREEYGRMGIGTRSRAWRFTDINKDYNFSPTYPARLVVPTRISDTTLQYASKYRSKARIPALTYLHWGNYGSITRSSQPMVGLTANRSIQDEKLIEAIFQSHHAPESKVSAAPVYGATATNLIIDARPTTNAVANTAKGAGTENMDHYREAKKAYLGIDNIHVVRDALGKVVDCLYQADLLSRAAGDVSVEGQNTPFLDRQALRRSGWLKLLSAIMEGTVLIVRNIHVNSSHVLIHCSDGWDRTAQLSALAQICLDPYYRTLRGFQVLIEKDWVSFGHRFRDRCGHLSSDKFFVAPTENVGNGGGAEAAQAFFASVQNRFASQGHLKEISPVFHQFLECVRQIQRQFPNRFEFNERFLRQMHTHLYSCQFGNFLYNCERERREPDASGRAPFQRTVSVWDFFNSATELELNRNGDYDKSLDDPASRVPKADMGVLMPNTKDIRFWNELYGRSDDEMNGRISTLQDTNAEVATPVSGSTEDSSGQATPQEGVLPEQAALTRETSTSEVVEDESWLSTGTIGRRGSAQAATSRQSTPSKAGTQDLFGAGLKSVWGRLSTNASAAFTAVQGAYDGVARDFSNVSLNSESSNSTSEGGGELRGRGDLASWSSPFSGEDQSSSSSAGTANPWSSSALARRLPSVLSDNPWGTERQPATPSRPHVSQPTSPDISWSAESNALPIDPTVVDPASIRRAGNRTELNPWAIDTLRSSAAPTPAPAFMESSSEPSQDSSAGASKSASDPLGIGPL